MFAVMGITGNVGGTIADTLLQHGKKVRWHRPRRS